MASTSNKYAKYMYQQLLPINPDTLAMDIARIITKDLFLRSLQKDTRDDLYRLNMLHLPLKDLMLHARNIKCTRATRNAIQAP